MAISFIIPSKLSLFPSLSFMILTVSSETDCWACQLGFVSAGLSLRVCMLDRRAGPSSYVLLCPHVEIRHYGQKSSSRWAQISCWQTSCVVCVVAAGWGVGRPGQEREPGPDHAPKSRFNWQGTFSTLYQNISCSEMLSSIAVVYLYWWVQIGVGGTVTEITHLFLPLGSICPVLHHQVALLLHEYFGVPWRMRQVRHSPGVQSLKGTPKLHYQDKYFNGTLKKIKMNAKKSTMNKISKI